MTEYSRHYADAARDIHENAVIDDLRYEVRRKNMMVAGGRTRDPQTHEEFCQRIESLARHLRNAPEESRVEWKLEIAALAIRGAVGQRRAEELRRLAFEDFQRDVAVSDPRGIADGLGSDAA